MTKVENKQFNISTDNQNYFRIESEGSIMSAEASSQQSLTSKVNLTRVLSEPIFYQMPQNNIKPVAPEKSIIKSPSITSEIKKSRKRCVSFSTHLREEIIDMPKMKENSISTQTYKGALTPKATKTNFTYAAIKEKSFARYG